MMVPLVFCVLAQANIPPAFLDARDVVVVGGLPGQTSAQFGTAYTVTAGSRSYKVIGVEPRGKPARDPSRPLDPQRVIIAGSFQSKLGGTDWDPDSESTEMAQVSPGVYEFWAKLPKGRYEFKITRGGSWNENYGAGFERNGGNFVLQVPQEDQFVRFEVDFNKKLVRDSISSPNEWSRGLPELAGQGVRKGLYSAFALKLENELPTTVVGQSLELAKSDGTFVRPIVPRNVLELPEFQYNGNDLGSRWSSESTQFKIWSPTSQSANLLLYSNGTESKPTRVKMGRGNAGVWFAKVPGNLHRVSYQYEFSRNGTQWVTADINCFAATDDLKHSIVVDLAKVGTPPDPKELTSLIRAQTNSIIYELHVRDFTIQPESGVDPSKRGTYLGLVQPGTKTVQGFPTGLDYLKWLGVTDVHLLPIQSFVFGGYSWGYGTTLFNVPEAGYATAGDDPLRGIAQTREMVKGLHANGLRVVMDVVYNHTWPPDGPDSAFQATVPYYYFRTDDVGNNLNESGVGNAMADERPMVRKYVRDSLVFWAKEYGIDGFRFDLLGMHQPESVRDWEKAVRAVRPDALIYGEPWTGGGPVHFGKGAQRGLRVGVFNDNFRSLVRGDTDGAGRGFSMGSGVDPNALANVVLGSVGNEFGAFADSPEETINYVSAHDNLTFWDKVSKAMPNATPETKESAVRLATAAVLLSQGVPFLEGGVEIGRDKKGNGNSYDGGDAINRFDWVRAAQFKDLAEYTRTLIALRKAHPAFRLASGSVIKSKMAILAKDSGKVVYRLDGKAVGDSWKEILVILNGNTGAIDLPLASGKWNVAVLGARARTGKLYDLEKSVRVPALSACVLYR